MDGSVITDTPISTNGQERYVTRMIGAALWEVRMLERLRQLLDRGDGHFLIQKEGDTIFICRIGKPEMVKGE